MHCHHADVLVCIKRLLQGHPGHPSTHPVPKSLLDMPSAPGGGSAAGTPKRQRGSTQACTTERGQQRTGWMLRPWGWMLTPSGVMTAREGATEIPVAKALTAAGARLTKHGA